MLNFFSSAKFVWFSDHEKIPPFGRPIFLEWLCLKWFSKRQTVWVTDWFIYIFLFNLFLYWRIIDLQNFAVFCQTSTWISHRYTHIPSLWTSFPSPSPSHPSGLVQSPCLSFLSITANSRWLFILYMGLCFIWSLASSEASLILTKGKSSGSNPYMRCCFLVTIHLQELSHKSHPASRKSRKDSWALGAN